MAKKNTLIENEIKVTEENLLFEQVKQLLDDARYRIARTVNTTIVNTYWQIGKYIVEYEQGGRERATFGKDIINKLSARLTKEYGKGFSPANIRYMRQFYQCFPFCHALSDKLTWTHWRTLLKVQNETARNFYLTECISGNWSVRQLERQINTLFYERMLASKNQEIVREEIQRSVPQTLEAKEIIRDPYILEFLGLSQSEHFLESDLEQMIITKLQHFLLELGRGYCFVARQKRISLDNQHFYIDLVFYNILARCYVLIDLKIDALTHQDLGQMQMYVNYYTRELMNPGDNPPIGIVLCAEKNNAVVEYTLPKDEKQIFAAQYLTYLPTKEELKQLLEGNIVH